LAAKLRAVGQPAVAAIGAASEPPVAGRTVPKTFCSPDDSGSHFE